MSRDAREVLRIVGLENEDLEIDLRSDHLRISDRNERDGFYVDIEIDDARALAAFLVKRFRELEEGPDEFDPNAVDLDSLEPEGSA